MSHEVRFSFKLLFKLQFWRSLNLRNLCKPVKPTLCLSKKAMENPLPEGLLSDIRDFLSRSGVWENHPIDSVETFMAIPAPGVRIKKPVPSVIGIDEPVFTSLGFGMEGVKDGVAKYTSGVCETLNGDTHCDSYLCITNVTPAVKGRDPNEISSKPAATAATCYDSFCGNNDCFENDCSSQKCGDQWCDVHSCSTHACGKQSSTLITSELQENWEHPFVKELAQYFGIDMQDRLATAVKHYVGRNMFNNPTK